MAVADPKSGKFKFSREAAGVSLNLPKFVHALSIRSYQSNQCTKIAILRNVLLMWGSSKSGNGRGSGGGFFETRFD